MSNIKDAISYALDGKLSDMSSSIESAIRDKVLGALEARKQEVAQTMFNPVAESVDPIDPEDEWDDDDFSLDEVSSGKYIKKQYKNPKIVRPKVLVQHEACDSELPPSETKNLKKSKYDEKGWRSSKDLTDDEVDEVNETLNPSMGVKKYIEDFIKSDDPRFAGDSKKKRIQRALAAFYADKRGE